MGAITWTMYGCGGDLTLTVTLAPATVEEEKAPWIDTVRAGRVPGHLDLMSPYKLAGSQGYGAFLLADQASPVSEHGGHRHKSLSLNPCESLSLSPSLNPFRMIAEIEQRVSQPLNIQYPLPETTTYRISSRNSRSLALSHIHSPLPKYVPEHQPISRIPAEQSTTAFITINQSSTFANVLHTCGDRLHDSAAKQDT
ncbi:hypothetical protein Bbelb_368060 [Branchiostoma belcheri]|nr:hypothetical protein Bbelb_368060 [Branchiostoma belcheri]